MLKQMQHLQIASVATITTNTSTIAAGAIEGGTTAAAVTAAVNQGSL
jgi:hypothetical protein